MCNATKRCNLCKHIKYNHINNSYYDVFCTECNDRVLMNYMKIGEVVNTPFWCPLNDSTLKTWRDLTPQVVWESIKKGDKFHIPPIDGEKRKNITVLAATASFFSYTNDDNPKGPICYVYPSSREYKIMVRHRNR